MFLKTKDEDNLATYIDIDEIIGITVIEDRPNKFEVVIGMRSNTMAAKGQAAREILKAFKKVREDVIYVYDEDKLRKENK